jgi:hypothetical protein
MKLISRKIQKKTYLKLLYFTFLNKYKFFSLYSETKGASYNTMLEQGCLRLFGVLVGLLKIGPNKKNAKKIKRIAII